MNASLQWGVSFFEKPMLTLQFRNGSEAAIPTLVGLCSAVRSKAEVKPASISVSVCSPNGQLQKFAQVQLFNQSSPFPITHQKLTQGGVMPHPFSTDMNC